MFPPGKNQKPSFSSCLAEPSNGQPSGLTVGEVSSFAAKRILSGLEAQLLKLLRIRLPSLGHLDMQVELGLLPDDAVDCGAQLLLDA